MVKKLKEVKVSSLSEFAAQVEGMLPAGSLIGNWYRGVCNESYKLVPSLYRHPVMTSVDEFMSLEATMLMDFERFSILHNENVGYGGADDVGLRKLFFMQHYGIPTRLLDWSSNPFISLYFALSTASMPAGSTVASANAVVWVLDPTAWNETALSHWTHGKQGPLTHSEAHESYGPRKILGGKLDPAAMKILGERAACLLGITNSARMFAQRGVFTIFGKDLASIEDQYAAGKFSTGTLNKIIIPAAKVGTMLSSLLKMGYTDSVSYPDLQGLALEIRRSRGFGA